MQLMVRYAALRDGWSWQIPLHFFDLAVQIQHLSVFEGVREVSFISIG